MPAQSGSNRILQRMRRNYTKESYLDLVAQIKEEIPNVALTSDFIAGFCGETEEDHAETLDLIEKVGYDMAFLFAYSMRSKTHAYNNFDDDVPADVKQRRLSELIDLYRKGLDKKNEIGNHHLVLVEGPSRRDKDLLQGRTDTGKRVILGGSQAAAGDFVHVVINKQTKQTLFGDVVKISSIGEFYK